NAVVLGGIGGAAVVLVLGISAILLTTTTQPSSNPAADAAALRAYTAALPAPAAAAGQVVEQDMKPSLSDFRSGALDATTFAQRARSWQLTFRRTRDALDAIPTPVSVKEAAPLFDTALDGYRSAAALLEQAAAAAGADRSNL